MTDDAAYRDALARVAEADTGHDGRWHGVDHTRASIERLADLCAEAAGLAPPEYAGAWTTVAEVNRRFAAMFTADHPQRPSRDDIDALTTALTTLRAHAREDIGLDLFAAQPAPPIGPPVPIPHEPAFDVPDGPVDDAAYERLMADQPVPGVNGDPEQDMVRLAEFFTAAAAVAPWDVRPAWAVMAASIHDTLDRVRDPSIADRPARVSPDQLTAASAILSHADRWSQQAPGLRPGPAK